VCAYLGLAALHACKESENLIRSTSVVNDARRKPEERLIVRKQRDGASGTSLEGILVLRMVMIGIGVWTSPEAVAVVKPFHWRSKHPERSIPDSLK